MLVAMGQVSCASNEAIELMDMMLLALTQMG